MVHVLPTNKTAAGSGGNNKKLLLLLPLIGMILVTLKIFSEPKTAAELPKCPIKEEDKEVMTKLRQENQKLKEAAALMKSEAAKQRLEVPVAVPATAAPVQEKSFLEIAKKTGTDKVAGQNHWDTQVFKYEAENPKCAVWGHFYHTMYQKWLAPYSRDDADPFQFLEIGYSHGGGFAAFVEFLSKHAETHSMEIQCQLLENAQKQQPWHAPHWANNRMHCGDSSSYEFLLATWTQTMKRPADPTTGAKAAPPLKVVIEDASHFSHHQTAAVFFWFPRIEPGGIMVIEDVQPNSLSNVFREEFMPQILADVHYCGVTGPGPQISDDVCFPTLQPLLKSVHCEMHICVLERNEMPAREYSREQSIPPPNALNFDMCREKKKLNRPVREAEARKAAQQQQP